MTRTYCTFIWCFKFRDSHLSSFFSFSFFFLFLRQWNFNHPLFSPTFPKPPPLSPSSSEVSLSAVSASSLELNKTFNQSASPIMLRRASPSSFNRPMHDLHYLRVPSWLDFDENGTSPVPSIRLLGFEDGSFQDDF